MASRYHELFRIQPNLYLEGSPVLIEAGALQKDIVDDRVLVQVKIRNISNKKIVACKVCIWAYEPSGTEIEGIGSFPYLDIAVKQGQDFGTKTPIYLPDNTTRKFDVAVIEVVFDDDTVWSDEPAEWVSLPAQNRITDVLDDYELAKQYGLEAGDNSSYYPDLTMGLFLCTCGGVNIGGENSRCYKCGRTYSDLIKILDIEDLTKRRDERVKYEEEKRRLEREREEKKKAEAAKIAAQRKAEEERIAEKIRKQKLLEEQKRERILRIVVPIAILILIFILLYPGVIRPSIHNYSNYKTAVELLENGEYDEANHIFRGLGTYRDSELMAKEAIYKKAESYLEAKKYDEATELFRSDTTYKDSAELAKEAQYQKADDFYAQGNYEEAINIWKNNSTYSDSEERIKSTEIAWKDADYQSALQMMEDTDYLGASEAFALLGDYSDSAEKAVECVELQKEKEYQEALKAIDENDKEKAILMLEDLKDYKDAAEICESTAYNYAKELAAVGDYEQAVHFFGYSLGYEDSDSLRKAARYGYGCQLLDEKNYEKAIAQFENCKDYKGAKERLNEAKYGYVLNNLERKNNATYNYLKDLVDENYPGAKSTYNDLYKWTVDFYAINSNENDEITYSTSLSKYGKWVFHFRLEGGPLPSGVAKETIYYKFNYPDGSSSGKELFSETCHSGSEGSVSAWYGTPTYGSTGVCSVTIYDSSGNNIGSASVNVTN